MAIEIIIAVLQSSQMFIDNCRNSFFYEQLFDDDVDGEYVALNGIKEAPIRTHLYIENVVMQYNSKQFQEHFRMSSETFSATLTLTAPLLSNHSEVGRPTISPQKQFLSVLWLLATPDSYRSVAERFGMSNSSLHHSFIRMIHVLNQLAPETIKWPQSAIDIENIVNGFRRSGLNNIIGAIDGSYIPIKAPKDHPEVYICRKRFHAITLQAICTYDLKFTDCFTGYPSSVNDLRIFKNSTIYKSFLNHPETFFPNDEFIIGDKAYPLRRWCITPYINRGDLTLRQLHFNTLLSRVRQAIERAFALLKGKFRRLKYLDMSKIDLIPATILACCVLHNLCINNSDGEIENYILEGMVANIEVQNVGNEIIIDDADFENEAGTLRRDRVTLAL